MSPVRTSRHGVDGVLSPGQETGSGSRTPRSPMLAMIVAFEDHVVPWSLEKITATLSPRLMPWPFEPLMYVNPSTSVPSGSTTIWLAIVWVRDAWGAKILRAGSQLAP